MSRSVIHVEGLGKEYVLGQADKRNETFREMLTAAAAAPFRRLRRLGGSVAPEERFWALKDVNFEVKEGEVVGIIGRNGAGKSTLLKILSRITAPTEGHVRIHGRVASLLEVGTGFHPELTGLENIFLNGAILGMGRREIERKFDEIVAFAEVEKFIDTPIKHYSSGMYVRLAFAVAAHLDPEILLVDEVLAVGDASFQKKCINKMSEISGQGRTVIFVSHNHQAIRSLCSRGVLLAAGTVVSDGPINSVLSTYTETLRGSKFDEFTSTSNTRFRRGNGAVRFTDIRVTDKNGHESNVFSVRDTVRFDMRFKANESVDLLSVSMIFFTGHPRTAVTSVYKAVNDCRLTAGDKGRVILELPELNLRPGEYSLYFWLGKSEAVSYDTVDDIVSPIVIEAKGDYNTLGYNPARPMGFFDVASSMRWCSDDEDKEMTEPFVARSQFLGEP